MPPFGDDPMQHFALLGGVVPAGGGNLDPAQYSRTARATTHMAGKNGV